MTLTGLLRSLAPVIRDGQWVFCSLDPEVARAHAHAALASMREDEGTSLVLPRTYAADAGLADAPAFRCITLTVHSSLEAVGLTAAVATALAARGIAANVIAAARHDHVFVPAARADEALAVLCALSAGAHDAHDPLSA
ncbi:MAG: ACT domain-containing protein [Gemmatirosa sp.]